MESSLEQLLRDHYTDGIFHTHVSMVQPKGKYQFDRQGLENFWSTYCNLITTGENPIVGIAEKPQHYLPVLGDIDIKIKEEEGEYFENLYTEQQAMQIIEIYQSVLRNIVDECNDDSLSCILLEKPMYKITKNNITYIKNGFHLHFPNLFLSKVDQEVQLIPRVQDAIRDLNLFESVGLEDSGLVIDKACCKVPWLLYGSRKSEDMDPYLVSKVITSEGNEVSLEDAFKHYRLFNIQERIINVSGQVEKYLPRILSILPYGRQPYELKHGLVSPLKIQIAVREKTKHTKISTTEALAESAKLIPMLARFRAQDRNEWMTVGWILFNIGEGSSDALDQWLDFSSQDDDSYDEGTCIYEWGRMVKKDLTLGTLKYNAKNDNPELYREFQREQAETHINESLNGSHNDVAKTLFAYYGTEFVCASVASKTWFQFVGHHWEEIEDGTFLRERISNEIVQDYIEKGKNLFIQMANVEDKAEETMYNARVKQVQKLISNLKSAPYKNNVMRECLEVFYDKRFRQKLDMDPYLIAFKNGVYDLKNNTFRNGRPEDFLSKSMPINYTEYDDGDEQVLAVYDYLEKVFPDRSIRQYFMDQASDIFVGGNHQKVVLFWTGEGDNAKSVTQSIFEKMMGELAIKFSTTLITGKKTQTGSAQPELARAGNGVRWAVLEEPDGDEQINIGTMKSLSGNDSYWARDLFEKGKSTREITPMFKLIFICNKLPKMRYSDKATWNRIRVIPFESTFVRPGDPCPETYEEQMLEKRFPMDKDFGKRIPDLVQAFAWVLLKHRQNITVRVEPEKVRSATAMYRKQNDVYRQFVEECITDDDNYVLSLIELYASFKDWFKEGFPGHQLPVRNEVKEYFSRLWDEPEPGGRWRGYRIKTIQDNIDNGSIVILDENDLVDYDDNGKSLPPM